MALAEALDSDPTTLLSVEMLRPEDRLIVALDVPSVDEARSIVDELGELVAFFKIGWHLQWRRGFEKLVDELIESDREVFLDCKLADIPETMRAGIEAAAELGARFLTIQGNGDLTEELVGAAIEGKQNDRPQIFCVTLLTSLDEEDAQTRYQMSVQELVLERARQAKAWGCDGVIASGREAKAIKRELGPGFLVITPGIRPSGSARNDQKRVVTPGQAIEARADYLVVGRPIVKAKPGKRLAEAEAIVAEMTEALEQMKEAAG